MRADRNCLSNVLGRTGGDEIVVTVDDQRWNSQGLELGKQVEVSRDHVSFMSRASTALALRMPSLVKLALSLFMNLS